MSTLFSHFFEKINHMSPLAADCTEVLDSIALKPKTLYFYGKMPQNVVKTAKNGQTGFPERKKTVAIVGSRHNTKYGEAVAYKIAYELTRRGVIIVSGLAHGIDSIGHRACLDAGGTTIAVLGTPIDQIYPKAHLGLAAEIIEKGGAVMSEYPPLSPDYADAPLAPTEYYDEAGHRTRDARAAFLYRNRLISGLADAVVVVEAAEKSGTLSTAAHALSQGKDVYAVPGNITSPYSQGCNALIRQGATPVTCVNDILRDLFPDEFVRRHKVYKAQNLLGDNEIETKILSALATGLTSGEDIMKSLRLPPELFNEFITLLEVKGRVRPLGMNNWSLC